ncbi:MAG: DUF2239 family protein [Rhodobacter sp.]|nr:DUF2239 family protein [Paracoccaceae bacterium]MCC0076475.1 DUF2239 family protein [Rhodobacter sp.]
MTATPETRCTAFQRHTLIAQGPLAQVAPLALAAGDGVLVFDDATGRIIDLDPRDWTGAAEPPKRRGRPKLGVIPREVTLLQRHWDWLAQQPGGASAALRRLVDEARKADGGRTAQRAAREAAYRLIHALAGDLPGYEDATRALFAGDLEGFAARMAGWPEGLRAHAFNMAQGDLE